MAGIFEEIVEIENRAWEANRKGDADFYRRYLTDDAISVASFGVLERDAIVSQIAENRRPFLNTTMEGPRVMPLGKDSALITHRSTIEALVDGKKIIYSVLATTVYVKVGGEWKMAFHQQTPTKGL